MDRKSWRPCAACKRAHTTSLPTALPTAPPPTRIAMRAILCGTILCGALLAASVSQAVEVYAQLDGIEGGSVLAGREGWIEVFALDHEVVLALDPTSGLAIGKRTHKPLTLLKRIDKATPKLYENLILGRLVPSAQIDLVRADPSSGKSDTYFTYTLENVQVVSVKAIMPTSIDPAYANYGAMEEVRLVYRGIRWTDPINGVTAEDQIGMTTTMAPADPVAPAVADATSEVAPATVAAAPPQTPADPAPPTAAPLAKTDADAKAGEQG